MFFYPLLISDKITPNIPRPFLFISDQVVQLQALTIAVNDYVYLKEDIDTLDDLFYQIQEAKDKKEREEREYVYKKIFKGRYEENTLKEGIYLWYF